MLVSVAVPVAILIALGAIVPRLLERVLPETIPGMVWTVLVSSFVLWALSSLWFVASYVWLDNSTLRAIGADTDGAVMHFARLGLSAALIWLPIVLLTVVTAPRRWRHGRW